MLKMQKWKNKCVGKKRRRLEEKHVRQIRRMYFIENVSRRELSNFFSLTYKTIDDIICRRSWKHLPPRAYEKEMPVGNDIRKTKRLLALK